MNRVAIHKLSSILQSLHKCILWSIYNVFSVMLISLGKKKYVLICMQDQELLLVFVTMGKFVQDRYIVRVPD